VKQRPEEAGYHLEEDETVEGTMTILDTKSLEVTAVSKYST